MSAIAPTLLASIVAGALVVLICRWIARTDATAGLIVSAGLLLRLALAVSLFWVSYLELPFASSLQMGAGFWQIAPDARFYYFAAVDAAERGLGTVEPWSASPLYVKMLALWMRLVGMSPASGLLLNALSYAGLAAIVTAIASRHPTPSSQRAARLSHAALAASPALLIFGSQNVKDQFFTFLIGALCASAFVWLAPVADGRRPRMAPALGGVFVLVGTVYMMAGIRAYVAFLALWIVGGVLLFFAVHRPRHVAVKQAALAAVMVALLWIPFKFGAGYYYPFYADQVAGLLGISLAHSTPISAVTQAREGFVFAGGNTNIVPRFGHHPGAGLWQRLVDDSVKLAVGLSAMFVPISILQWTGVVEVAGGRGLLFVTDVDTLFLDASLVAVAVFMLRYWKPLQPNRPYVLFVAALGLIMMVLMAYVVTNFGTLFRLRLMPATLFWLLPLAVSTASGSLRPAQSEAVAVEPVAAVR